MYKYLIQGSISPFSSEKDAQEIEKFFKVRGENAFSTWADAVHIKQDKDVSKYDMVLAQSLDGIRARAKWSERSTAEVKEWLENRKKEGGGA